MIAKEQVPAVVRTIGILLRNDNFENARITANHLPDDCPEKDEMFDAISEREDCWHSLISADSSPEPARTEMLNYYHNEWIESGEVFFAKKAKMLLDGNDIDIWDLDIPKECEGVYSRLNVGG